MIDPMTCPHATDKREGPHILCDLKDTPTWVNCQTSICGERPRCCYEEPDNSPEAVERRLAFLEGGAG